MKGRSFLLASVPVIVPAIYWKIPAKNVRNPDQYSSSMENFHNERGSINIPRPVTESHRNSRVWGYVYRALPEQYAFRGEDRRKCKKNQPLKHVYMLHLRNCSKSSDEILSWVCANAGSPDLCWFVLLNVGLGPILFEEKSCNFKFFLQMDLHHHRHHILVG